MSNVYAHTGPTPGDGYARYISIDERGGLYRISVRGAAPQLGGASAIDLTPSQLLAVAVCIRNHLGKRAALDTLEAPLPTPDPA